MTRGVLLFHSPCFDGIVSAVLVSDFLRNVEDWTEIELAHVNYDARETWLSRRFEAPAAIVDFLYHPDAAFWADHHQTTFLTDEVRGAFEQSADPFLFYDRAADSCAGLLWRELHERFSYRSERYESLVTWAEKLDAARYDSVWEATSFVSPASQISIAAAFSTNGLCETLVRALTDSSLDEVAAMDDVRNIVEGVRESAAAGIDRLKQTARLHGEIVVFDVDARDVFVSRYAPYALFPEARYSIGVTRGEHGAKITAMRNPWLDFESVPLGRIFSRFGGGGHQRVASLLVPPEREVEAAALVGTLASLIADGDRNAETKP